MPNTTALAGWKVAERIRTRLTEEPLVIRPELSVHQTVSVGLATWDGKESAEALDHRADVALYEAKHNGRDRTVVAPAPQQDAGECWNVGGTPRGSARA